MVNCLYNNNIITDATLVKNITDAKGDSGIFADSISTVDVTVSMVLVARSHRD
jgi:nicotinamide riboside transporter PnuC